MKIQSSNMIPKGKHALTKNGKVVFFGTIGDPIENIDCDGVIMHPDEVAALNAELDRLNCAQ